jgi:hypothetical protein
MTKMYVETAVSSQTVNSANFLKYMKRAYGDPNQKERANNKLSSMRQGKDSAAAFLPKYERTLAEAGGAEWSDDVKVNTLKRMLNKEILEVLVVIDLPQGYTEFIRIILRTDARLKALKEHRFDNVTAKPFSTRFSVISATPADGESMDWEATIRKLIAAVAAGDKK